MRYAGDDKAAKPSSQRLAGCAGGAAAVSSEAMKPAQILREWRVGLGLAMVVIGAANWSVGRHRAREYSSILATQPADTADQAYRSFEELGAGAADVLEPFTDEQRRVSYAMARMDFYHAAFLSGEVLVISGAVMACLGFLGIIRRDAFDATARRLDLRTLGKGPLTG
jgi:hypothetical protein